MRKARLSVTFRILHWSVATFVLLNIFVFEEGKYLHRYIGYAAFFFVLVRILLHRKRQVTHYNSKAKYIYWSIWGCIIFLGLSGFLMGLDRFWGNQIIEDIHEALSNVLVTLSVVHLVGIFIDAILNNRKTWMVMFSGEKN